VVVKRRQGSVSSMTSTTSDDSGDEYEEIPSYLPPLPTFKKHLDKGMVISLHLIWLLNGI